MTSVLPKLVLVLLILGVVIGGVLIYALKQRAAIGEGKTPSLPPKREPPPPAPNLGSHMVVTLRPGQSLAEQLPAHTGAAELRKLRPVLEVGAVWCPPSRLFGEALADPRMHAALAGVYLIRVDMDEFDGDPKLRELGVTSVPVFFELDAAGQATGHSMTGAAWGADTIENMSAALAKFCA
jgi:hypothetical protein